MTCTAGGLLEDWDFANPSAVDPAMPESLRTRLFDALDAIELIDPHTHINAHSPASTTLADIMGYHYYTELAHSAGMPRAQVSKSRTWTRRKKSAAWSSIWGR